MRKQLEIISSCFYFNKRDKFLKVYFMHFLKFIKNWYLNGKNL